MQTIMRQDTLKNKASLKKIKSLKINGKGK